MPRTKSKKPAPAKRVRKSAALREKERFTGTDPNAILSRAMLVGIRLGDWDGRKHDAVITDKVNTQYHAAKDAGRYHKSLFGGKPPELKVVQSYWSALRRTHEKQTLPWTDSGWRLLPTANHQQYTDSMRQIIKQYYEAADALADAYPRLKLEAQVKLNGMYRESDYPSAAEIRSKFYAKLDWSPIAAGSDFRVQLPQAELAQLAKSVEDRLRESISKAIEDIWARLGDAIVTVRDHLDDGKGLRDSMIERLSDVTELLGRLNLTDDPRLEATRLRVKKELAAYGAETLKADPKVRRDVAMKADEILKSMSGLYSPAVKEESNDTE